MEDYLSEKEQWEAIKVWLRENGLWIVAGVAAGAAVLGGWRWYQGYNDGLGMQASAKYEQVLQAFDKGDRTQALVHLGELERNYASSPYVDQAKLSAARSYVDSGDLELAAKDLQAVADRSKDSGLKLIARLRLARVQIAQKQPDLALTTLSALQPGAFAAAYHEVRGDAYFAKGDRPTALKEYFTAKAANFGASPESEQLDLKITDLSSDSTRLVSQTPPAAAAASK